MTETDSEASLSLSRAIEGRFGVSMGLYKQSMLDRRLADRMAALQMASVAEYEARALEDPTELEALLKAMLVSVTRFFRDPEVFEQLRCELLPELVESSPPDRPLRCWVSACATGEEAISVAMVLESLVRAGQLPAGYIVEATDVHAGSIEFAAEGVYPSERASEIPEPYRHHFLEMADNSFRVIPEVRDRVRFSRHDLLVSAPLTNMDLVFCRNLLIYLVPKAKEKVLSLLHSSLRPEGLLVCGMDETRTSGSGFAWANRGLRVLRKSSGVAGATRDALLPAAASGERAAASPGAFAGSRRDLASQGRRRLAAYDALLNRFMPAGFLVEPTGALQETFGEAEQLVGLAGRRPSLLLWDLLGLDSDGELARAIRETASDSSRRTVEERFDDGETREVGVEPLLAGGPTGPALLVLIDPSQVGREHGQKFITGLGEDLARSRIEIDRLSEQLRSSTEELQAANEELVVSNEELRNSNEELYQANLELEASNQERRATIRRLRLASSDFNSLLQSTNVGAMFLGAEFDIRLFTTSVADFFGLLPEDLGRDFLSFSERFREIDLQQLLEEARDQGRRFHGEVHDRDGRAFLLDVSRATDDGEGLFSAEPKPGTADPASQQLSAMLDDDERPGFILTLVNLEQLVQERAKAERLAALVESSTELIVSLDFDGRVVHWNRGAEVLLGFPAARMLKHPLSSVCTAADREHLTELEQLALGGEQAEHEGLTFVDENGEEVILSVSLSPVYVGGKLMGSACLGRDVTSRRQIETALRKNERFLRLEVDRRERFLAMLSHELRNPMNAVAAATAVITHRNADAQARERARASIQRQTGHLRRLLDDLLDVSRVTSNKLELKTQRLDVLVPIEAALETARAMAEEHGVTVHETLPDTPVLLNCDPDRIQQMVSNLLSNAVKFADPRNGEVCLRAEVQGDELKIFVEDNGSGVPADVRESIFDLFVQSDSTLDRSAGGMGLGLTLVRAIARLHGGTAELAGSSPDSGTVFVVSMPLPSHSVELPPKQEVVGPAKRLSVLVIEDLADSREALATSLELEGHQVWTAIDGASGLDAAKRRRPDLILCDIGLPGLDGYEVARHVRTQADLDATKIVALTGYGRSEDVAAAIEAGFDAHLTKPLQFEELEATIERLFSD